MKNTILLLGGLCLSATSSLSAFTQLGNGDLYLDGRLDFAYDSNLFIRDVDALDDFMGILYTGIGFLQEERSVLNAEFDIGIETVRMFDYSEEDAEDWKTSFGISYPNNVERHGYFELNGGWSEDTQANADIGQRIETDELYLEAEFHQAVSERLLLEFSGAFNQEDYRNGIDPTSNLALDRDSEIMSFKAVGVYGYSEKLYGTLMYQYRDLQYNDVFPIDQTGNVLAVGARGQILPKVSGSVFLGFQDLDLSSPVFGNRNFTDPFYSVNVEWAPRDKTTVSLTGDSNFQSSVYGDVNNQTNLILQVNQRVSDKVGLNGSIAIADYDYEGLFERKDDSIIFSVGYFYSFDEQTLLNVRMRYEDRGSSLDGLGYGRFYSSVGITSLW